MLATARRRQGRIATRMPTVSQVQVAAGGWDQACRLAGLRSGPAQARSGGMPVVEALDLAVTTFGALPSQKGLERFMRANRLALARRTRPWADDLAALRRRRSARGLNTPAGPAGSRWRRDFEVAVSGLAAAQRKVATGQECEEAVGAWLGSLAPGERPTQCSYAQWQAEHPERPSASVLGRHGGLRELRARASNVGPAGST